MMRCVVLNVFTHESSYCAILYVRLSHGWITKSSPSAAWKTLVLGTVKLFHKFEGDHPKQGR